MKINIVSILFMAALVSASCSEVSYDTLTNVPVIPQPMQSYAGTPSTRFRVPGATISVSESPGSAAADRVRDFASALTRATGQESEIVASKGDISFTVDSSLAAESYVLTVSPEKVTVEVADLNGCIYAIQTLSQLLPAEIYSDSLAADLDWSLPVVKITDKPRFSYRGMHLDVSRHFFSVDEVKKYIDAIVMHKMNRLHWHLTDDQGWRVQIDAYPKLTEIGAYREETVIGKNSGKYDGIPYGGFYTKDQIREVVKYAADRGVTIIPEIDMPGHMLAALASYPELGCTGGHYDVWGMWGIADDVLCLGKEETYVFLERVFDEICGLFPSEYIHIGGDECPKVRWESCPDCQAVIAGLDIPDDAPYAKEYYLQSHVTKRMESYLAEKGRKIIGWDEILEGEISPTATVMSWRGVSGGEEAAGLGHDVIMVPTSHFYFDYYQTLNPEEREPFGIGGYVPVEKVYGFEPFSEGMTDEEKSHILGCQANLWTEYVLDMKHLEHMLLPRLCALSEVQWCFPENKNYDSFLLNMSHMFDILDQAGYSYAPYLREDGLVK